MALSNMVSMTGELYNSNRSLKKVVIQENGSEDSDEDVRLKNNFKLPQLEKYYTIIDPL